MVTKKQYRFHEQDHFHTKEVVFFIKKKLYCQLCVDCWPTITILPCLPYKHLHLHMKKDIDHLASVLYKKK